jgi:hypothetical protein
LKARIGEKNYGLLILGQSLIALSTGAIYFRVLINSGAWFAIFIISILLSTYYINTTFLIFQRGDKIKPRTKLFGFVGGFLLLMLFGIQSPQLPLKRYILLAGLILILPAIKDIIRPKKNINPNSTNNNSMTLKTK